MILNLEFDDSRFFIHRIFTDLGNFFDFMISNEKRLNSFTHEIQDAIQSMETILYLPPYPILFGRLSTRKANHNSTSYMETFPFLKNINKMFFPRFWRRFKFNLNFYYLTSFWQMRIFLLLEKIIKQQNSISKNFIFISH